MHLLPSLQCQYYSGSCYSVNKFLLASIGVKLTGKKWINIDFILVPYAKWLNTKMFNNVGYWYTGCQKVCKWGVGFLTVNKICFKHFVLLLLCVCIHNWSVSQWKQYELQILQIWSSWRNIIFESEKCHKIPLKMDTLTVSAFDAFTHIHVKSKHYLSHRFAQRRYIFTQCI